MQLYELWSEAKSYLDLTAETSAVGLDRSINVGETFTIDYILHNTAPERSTIGLPGPSKPRYGFRDPALLILGTQYAAPIDSKGDEVPRLELSFPTTFLEGGQTTRTGPIDMLAKAELPGSDLTLGSDDFDALERIATVNLSAKFDLEGYFWVAQNFGISQEIDPG
ncbi:MAG: hypothetical protein QF521_16445 [Alphaproteobacteria bacterium]|jgi:hypothetical protein|nr:hypothetical protein [Alphaproteobacteria bacterium]